jgi:hypothetical protein
LPDSIVCYDSETIVIYRRRRNEWRKTKNENN